MTNTPEDEKEIEQAFYDFTKGIVGKDFRKEEIFNKLIESATTEKQKSLILKIQQIDELVNTFAESVRNMDFDQIEETLRRVGGVTMPDFPEGGYTFNTISNGVLYGAPVFESKEQHGEWDKEFKKRAEQMIKEINSRPYISVKDHTAKPVIEFKVISTEEE